MTGAAVLCGSAALRGGAGIVQVACPADVQSIVAVGNPCYMTFGIPQYATGTDSEAGIAECIGFCQSASVIAIGPGLGRRPEVIQLVTSLLEAHPTIPIVLDADGITVLSPLPEAVRNRTAPLVLTPHPGEFAGLLNIPIAEVQANREQLAVEFARQHNVVLLLKGHRTIITDGERIAFNPTGNPGMATGGSGDVLTGLIAALIAQGLSGFDAAQLGAWIHGRAGDLAANEGSQVSMIASDLLDYLPQVFREIEPLMSRP